MDSQGSRLYAEGLGHRGQTPVAIVIARIQGRRRVYHPAHSVVPAEATRWEVEHLRAARYGAQEPFLFGGEISSFPDPAGGEGCAIVWPLEATD